MKIFFIYIAALLFFNVQAHASTENPSDPSSNNLANLQYYVHKGNFLVEPSFSSVFHEEIGSTVTSFNNFNLYAAYGLPWWEGLRIAVSETDPLVGFSSTGTSRYYTGLADPSFNVNYRFVDDSPEGLSLDGEISWSPSISDHRVPSAGTPGTNGKGYDSFDLSAAAFWKKSSNDLKISASFNHESRFMGYYQNDPALTNYSRGPLFAINAALTDRVHITPKFFTEAEANFQFSQNLNYSYSNNTTSNTKVPFRISPTVAFGYLYAPKLLFAASVAYQGDTATVTTTDSQSQTENRETSWALHATFEF